jgi:NifU-like protein involved in Fe-S cluster formation
MSAERLYSPAMLAAAMELAGFPPIENAPFNGAARSPACGSTLDMDLLLHDNGGIERIGMTVRACAVGQAAAAVFARHAPGLTLADIREAQDRFEAWLDDEGPAPDWPDIGLIAPAREFRGRHGAMLLPWKAAMEALSSTASAS